MARFLPTLALFAIALSIGDASAGGRGWSPLTGEPHPCEKTVDFRLKPYGLTVDGMSWSRWVTDWFGGERSLERRVGGYQFYGRPASCASGEVVISLWPNCGVQQIYTRGGCSVPGLD